MSITDREGPRIRAQVDAFGMEPRFTMKIIAHDNIWIALHHASHSSHRSVVDIQIEPKDKARFQRAIDAFNAELAKIEESADVA